MLDTFDVLPDRFGADITGRAELIGRGLQMGPPQLLLQHRKLREQLPGAHYLENLDGIRDSLSRRNTEKQMNVIGLDLLCDYRPASFRTKGAEQPFKRCCHRADNSLRDFSRRFL